jgi:recombinational DNA repair ATPase RecF
MTNYYEAIYNISTGETTTRPYTDDEIAAVEAAKAAAKAEIAKAAAKEAARQVLLDKLGITADEAKLLLG